MNGKTRGSRRRSKARASSRRGRRCQTAIFKPKAFAGEDARATHAARATRTSRDTNNRRQNKKAATWAAFL
jgi:hypothetical protein